MLLTLLVDVVHECLFPIGCRSLKSSVERFGARSLGLEFNEGLDLVFVLDSADDALSIHSENSSRSSFAYRIIVLAYSSRDSTALSLNLRV